MKRVYVIQMNTKTIPSRFISLFTMYKYSHVAISFNKDCDITYSFGRKNLYSIFNGGFVVEKKNGKFFKKFKDTRCRIYEVNVSDKQYNNLIDKVKYMEENQNIYGYDYLGVILRYLKIPVRFKNRYVCSYFVAKLLKDANVCNFKKNTWDIKPRDFEKMEGFKLIYSGRYSLYGS